MKIRAILLGVLAGLVAGGLLVLLAGASIGKWLGRGPDPATIAAASLQSVKAQNTLTAFAAGFNVAVTSEQTRLGVFTAKKTLIVPGIVRYELDWNRVTPQDLAWDAGSKTLTVTVPRPTVSVPAIDLTRIREFKDGAVLFALTDAEAAFDSANRARAVSEMTAEAQSPTLVAMADKATTEAVARTFTLPLAAANVDARVVVKIRG